VRNILSLQRSRDARGHQAAADERPMHSTPSQDRDRRSRLSGGSLPCYGELQSQLSIAIPSQA